MWEEENARLKEFGLYWAQIRVPALVHTNSRRTYELAHPGVREVSLEIPRLPFHRTPLQQAAAARLLDQADIELMVQHNTQTRVAEYSRVIGARAQDLGAPAQQRMGHLPVDDVVHVAAAFPLEGQPPPIGSDTTTATRTGDSSFGEGQPH